MNLVKDVIFTENNTSKQYGSKRLLQNDDENEEILSKKLKTENVDQLETQEFHGINNESSAQSNTKVINSPKKRLEVPSNGKFKEKNKEKFIYGNYSQYYGYRNKDFRDVRLDMFAARRELFENKVILDIGCNNGLITATLAKNLNVKSITGLDIDRTLIKHAVKNLIKEKKKLPLENEARRNNSYPFNVQYINGNYVLKHDCLLEIERPQFDTILCLSITKWIQLNFGDAGLKQAFQRMFLQLRSGGCLILEPQPFKNYKKRKNISETVRSHFENLQFKPEQFNEYLLSNDVGFKQVELLGVPENCVDGFKRPIYIFKK